MKSISFKVIEKLKSKNKDVIGKKINSKWKWYTNEDLLNRYYQCKEILRINNFKNNDRLVYKGKNSFDFISWNLAVNSEGGIWVPVYHNQNESYLNYILDDCKPSLLISDDKTSSKDIISLNSNDKIGKFNGNDIFKSNDTSTLIYTSGTTGDPKGVMLSDENIMSNIDGIKSRFKEFESDELTSLNILPWAHIYSITTELYYNLLEGNKIAISSGPDKFVKELLEIKPNVLYLVPKVLEIIKAKLNNIDYPIIKYLIPHILKGLFGKSFKTIFIGGAKLDDSTFKFYKDNGINICLGYGCSETSPMVSVNHLTNPRDESSVGKLLDDVIVKIVNDEILVAGPNVMKGYWEDKKKTDEVLIKNDDKIYYKTGDSGYVKNDFLYLTGRISENYKLSNGKFVNVADVESKIKSNLSGNFIVYGENRNCNILITDLNIERNKIIELCNRELDQYLKIKDILYIENDKFQIYLTPKMSIKRKLLIKDYMSSIEELYK